LIIEISIFMSLMSDDLMTLI